MKVERAPEEAMADQITYTVGSGNVFADIGVVEPVQAQLKADLAMCIGDIIRQRGLTQTAAARLLGVDQPKVSALLRGRLSGFTIDRLVKYAAALGQDVQIMVRPRGQTSSGSTQEDGEIVTLPESLRQSLAS